MSRDDAGRRAQGAISFTIPTTRGSTSFPASRKKGACSNDIAEADRIDIRIPESRPADHRRALIDRVTLITQLADELRTPSRPRP